MKRLIYTLVAASLAFTLNLNARDPELRYEGRDDRYHRFGRITLDQVRADLAQAERNLHYVAEHDMRRFHNVREGLAEFQRKWEHGRYDGRDLEQAMMNLSALVDRGRLRPRDRDILAGDLRLLRDLHNRIERGPRR